jgi:hypothetical protein
MLRCIWWRAGEVRLSDLMATIALGALFYGVITPMGVIMRLCGRPPLWLRPDPRARTYWIRRSAVERAGSMARQY